MSYLDWCYDVMMHDDDIDDCDSNIDDDDDGDDDRYVGQWRDNKKNGFGALYYNSGSVYEGDFKDDQRHGK